MKLVQKGSFLYLCSGPQYQTELPAEEYVGIWKPIDDTHRIEVISLSQISAVDLYPDLYELHLYIRGRKTPRSLKFSVEADYQKAVGIFQSFLGFEVM